MSREIWQNAVQGVQVGEAMADNRVVTFTTGSCDQFWCSGP